MGKKRGRKGPYAKSREVTPMPEQTKQRPPETPATPSAQAAHTSSIAAPPTRSAAQRRAAHALARIQELRDLPLLNDPKKLPYGNYVSFAESLPAFIVMCGLGQALAFEMSRGRLTDPDHNKAKQTQLGHHYLAQHVKAWLTGEDGWECGYYRNGQNILQAIFTGDESYYIAAQAEALLYLDWLKKFAVALLVKKEEED